MNELIINGTRIIVSDSSYPNHSPFLAGMFTGIAISMICFYVVGYLLSKHTKKQKDEVK